MEVLYPCCCGIDVHAEMLVACVINKGKKEIRTFSTMTEELLRLLDWLTAEGCTQVAIESTGVYWRPVFNILEGSVEVMLVNARKAKGPRGRKTDVIDAEWLADLLRHGLLEPSFIPPRHIRELRELTRYRESLVRDQTALANRIQKVIESGNIKLGHVVSDALGVSGKRMLRALAKGETDVEKMSELAHGRIQRKQPQLRQALTGRLTEAQCWVLTEWLDQYEAIEAALARVQERIKQEVERAPDPFVQEAVKLLDTIPGVAETVAHTVVSEIGIDMERFPSHKHISSWAGMCPGNNESAGKRKSGKTTKGSRYLRVALVQAAWAASHQKATYLAAQYRRLVKRMGKKKALVAVGHSILVIAYHVLRGRVTYEELGGDYFDRRNTHKQRQRLIRQLQSLGLKVTVEEPAAAA
jgi:transposase